MYPIYIPNHEKTILFSDLIFTISPFPRLPCSNVLFSPWPIAKLSAYVASPWLCLVYIFFLKKQEADEQRYGSIVVIQVIEACACQHQHWIITMNPVNMSIIHRNSRSAILPFIYSLLNDVCNSFVIQTVCTTFYIELFVLYLFFLFGRAHQYDTR